MRKMAIGVALLAVLISAYEIATVNAQEKMKAHSGSSLPDIRGSYMLVSRELPDGTVMTPPEIIGMLTMTERYRNFNVAWSDTAGKMMSLSYIAEYTLNDKGYTETSLYMLMNDEISGAGLKYDFSQPTGKAPVTLKDGGLAIKFPLYNEPELIWRDNTITATRPGEFVDHWERVQ